MQTRQLLVRMAMISVFSSLLLVDSVAASEPGETPGLTHQAASACETLLSDHPDLCAGPQGPCDDPSIRDATPVTGHASRKMIRTAVTVVNPKPGPGIRVTLDDVRTYLALTNNYLESVNIHLAVQSINVMNDPDNFYSRTDANGLPHFPDAAAERGEAETYAADLIEHYANNPLTQFNILIVSQGTNPGILGLSVQPWTAAARTTHGATLLDSWNIVEGKSNTLAHECGHVFGLWHTCIGSYPWAQQHCGDACAERVTQTPAERDLVGDFCSDTRPIPESYLGECVDTDQPFGSDCLHVAWHIEASDRQNIMRNCVPDCALVFTPQQVRRMHCWIDEKLVDWVVPVVYISGIVVDSDGIQVEDGTPIDGFPSQLNAITPSTIAGAYSGWIYKQGSTTLTPVSTTLHFRSQEVHDIVQDELTLNFTARTVWTVSGTVADASGTLLSNAELDGFPLQLNPAVPHTDPATRKYSARVFAGESYEITPHYGTLQFLKVPITPTANNQEFNFQARPPSIQVHVTVADCDGNPITRASGAPGVPVTLLTTSGGTQQQVTGEDGTCTFTVNSPWSGAVYPSPPHLCMNPPCPDFVDYYFAPHERSETARTTDLAVEFRGGPEPTLVAPNDAAVHYVGELLPIEWRDSQSRPHETVIEVSRSGANGPWQMIHLGVPGEQQYNWSVSGPQASLCLVRVANYCNAVASGVLSDVSEHAFQIKNRVSILSPTSGVTWSHGSQHTISWDACGSCGFVSFDVLASTGSDGLFYLQQAGLPSTARSYVWTVSGELTSSARIMIVAWKADGSSESFASGFFTTDCFEASLSAPIIQSNGHPRYVGGTMSFSAAVPGSPCTPVTYQYGISRDGGATWSALALTNYGMYTWTITGPPANNCKARIVVSNSVKTVVLTTPRFAIAELCDGCPLPQEGREALPSRTGVVSCAPNPFAERVTLMYELAADTDVCMSVVGVGGGLLREVHLGMVPAGRGEWSWDGRDRDGRKVGSGVYFVRMQAGVVNAVRTVILKR